MLDQDYKICVGTYSDMDVLAHQPYAPVSGKGIYAMSLSQSGKLKLDEIYEALNPAVMIPHSNGKVLYAILETIKNEGDVLRYSIDADGALILCDQFRASGRSTCYLTLSPEQDVAIVINYWDAIIDVVDVDKEGRLGKVRQSFKQYYRAEDQWRQVENREDHWGNRQVGPHAHCAHFWKDWVFIPDLGENAVFQYYWDKGAKQLIRETYIEFEAGSGPRHMVMHPDLDICYVSNELFNTVCVARLDASESGVVKPRLVPLQYESTLDDRSQVSYVSEIKLSPDSKFLYVSNRGDNSIAIFKVLADGRIERRGLVSTGGKFPRHFAITPCGNAILVVNQDSGHIRVFARDIITGDLTLTDEVKEIPAPNYIRFIGA
ncbi:MAG: lactonase family protein [Gammaproteobacteria bacterium]|nr:lactonase family protein [Gammaproteobacteria bacterium]MCP4880817.1 lactonase family protein [Gammaproteobacteria bacterium]